MGIPHATVMQLQDEGIMSPDDLMDFDRDTIKQIAEMLKESVLALSGNLSRLL